MIGTLRRDLPSEGFNKKVVLITGELSGEVHALHLVEALKGAVPFEWSGIGSSKLAGAGVRIIYDYGKISLTGLSEIFAKLKYIREAFEALKRHIQEERPSLIILVDFPGFNLKVARLAKRYGIPVIYFIPPQIWAWRQSRIKQIKKFVDRVICILPFEKELYDRFGIDAAYIGHPFTNTVKPTLTREGFLDMIGVKGATTLITIMPGSRENEMEKHMPLLMEVVKKLGERFDNLKVILPLADSVDDSVALKYCAEGITFLKGHAYDALSYCDLAIVASGSATLEAAILGAPTIVVYKVSRISYLIARAVVRIKYISLPNIIRGEEVFPEFIQRIDVEDVAKKASYMLENGRKGIEKDVEEVKKRLGSYDSYRLAGESVVQFLEHRYGAIS